MPVLDHSLPHWNAIYKKNKVHTILPGDQRSLFKNQTDSGTVDSDTCGKINLHNLPGLEDLSMPFYQQRK